MLTFYGAGTKGPIAVDREMATLPAAVHWIDAVDPTSDETRFLEAVMGSKIPTRDDLVEIESSSRLMSAGGLLFMSLQATMRDADGYPGATPVGFVVGRERVVSVRFARLPSFENLAQKVCATGDVSEGGLGATVTILEIIVDHLADLLERIGGELDAMSRTIFMDSKLTSNRRGPRAANVVLGDFLRSVGRDADLVSKVSESLLGLSRMPPFVIAKGDAMLTQELRTRLDTIGIDARSLHEFQEHLANKTQFLLDTLLGLANIEQNNVFRVLTVVSVVGIPPTFFASMYGMNFKGMPEYDWTYGYAYGLTLIILSGLVPAIWFKAKGWW